MRLQKDKLASINRGPKIVNLQGIPPKRKIFSPFDSLPVI